MTVTPQTLREVADFLNDHPRYGNEAIYTPLRIEKIADEIEDATIEQRKADIELGRVLYDLVGESAYTKPELAHIGAAIRDYIAKESTYTPDLSVEDEWQSWEDVPPGVRFYSPGHDNGDFWFVRDGKIMWKWPDKAIELWLSSEDIDSLYAPFRAR